MLSREGRFLEHSNVILVTVTQRSRNLTPTARRNTLTIAAGLHRMIMYTKNNKNTIEQYPAFV